MLSMWNSSIFTSIKDRLQTAAMKLLLSERQGDAFDSQLVVGVRESFGMCIGYDESTWSTSDTKSYLFMSWKSGTSCTVKV